MTLDSFGAIRALNHIDGLKLRSAWDKGVRLYAHDLMSPIFREVTMGRKITSIEEVRKLCLNGAENWKRYARGGFGLIYDGDIAERLCTPSELKKCKGGLLNPNKHEDWLDVEARALEQAWWMVKQAILIEADE